jgi:coproporphyrinogen III oxidase
MQSYRAVFCRNSGFAQVSRYLTGLLLSPNKTLQGIHAQWVWPEGEGVQRRAMHAAVFESAGWNCEDLMHQHRQVVAPAHRGRAERLSVWIGRLRIIPTASTSTARKRLMITSIAAGVGIKRW